MLQKGQINNVFTAHTSKCSKTYTTITQKRWHFPLKLNTKFKRGILLLMSTPPHSNSNHLSSSPTLQPRAPFLCNKMLLLSKESYLCHHEVRFGISFTKHYIQKGYIPIQRILELSTRSDKVYILYILLWQTLRSCMGLMLSHMHRKSI